jgi:AcrR family transcriptional regulator
LSSAVVTDRPLRADARRNQERVLAAARECFAQTGCSAQMEDIAGRAGVGVGTVYRHFPNKEAVIQALVDEYFADLGARAQAALEIEDPWEAFSSYIWGAADMLGENRGLGEVTASGQMREGAERSPFFEAVGELITRAQRAGVMRDDVTIEDVPMIMCSIGRVQQLDAGMAASNWRRHLSIMLDGLRTGERSPLPND